MPDKLDRIPNRVKRAALPPMGTRFRYKDIVLEVTFVNAGKARATIQPVGRVEQSRIITPHQAALEAHGLQDRQAGDK
jgi:hypothetical protein